MCHTSNINYDKMIYTVSLWKDFQFLLDGRYYISCRDTFFDVIFVMIILFLIWSTVEWLILVKWVNDKIRARTTINTWNHISAKVPLILCLLSCTVCPTVDPLSG